MDNFELCSLNEAMRNIHCPNNIEELNLSEILFVPNSEANFETLKKQIYSEIEKSGFETAASIFSVSNSKNFGGKLGWVRSNQISPNIYLEIKDKLCSAEPSQRG